MNRDDDNTRTHAVLTRGTMVQHYQIVEKIGAGGMGEVYLAEDTNLRRKVALKFLPFLYVTDVDFKARFVREAEAMAKLNHPNIITIHEVSEHHGRPFFAMELVEGQSLRDLAKSKELSINRIIELAIQVCDGLSAAHDKKIVHRDIKPSNIVIDAYGRPKILDFGLAAIQGGEHFTKTGSTLGTVRYMSPEQVQGQEVDHRSDLFSLGVVLYELIAGRTPFERDNDAATLRSIGQEGPEPLTRYKSDIPDELQRTVSKLLEKDPSMRYQVATGVISDLKRLLAQTQSSGAVAAVTGKSRWHLVVGGLVVIAVLVVVGIKYWPADEPVPGDSPTPKRKMLAVLPFENLGAPEDEYFADGITDEITSHLAKLSKLGVISRTSSIQYKETDKDLPQIAQELAVDFILEGSIRWDKTGGTHRVRITPQLIRVSDNTHLWAENYEREMSSIFDVQGDIATRIATALNVALLEPERRALEERRTTDLRAYDYYLRGNDYFYEGYQDSRPFRSAALLYEKAIKLDSTFVNAYSRLSQVYTELYWHHGRKEEDLSRAKQAMNWATDLDLEVADVRVARASFYYHLHDYERAFEELSIAIDREPGNSEIIKEIGFVLRRQGKYNLALEKFKEAIKLDPRSSDNRSVVANTYLWMHSFDEADTVIDHAIALAPERDYFYAQKAWLQIMRNGDVERARSILEQIRSKADPTPFFIQKWGNVYACAGDYEMARELFEIEDPNFPGSSLYNQAAMFELMGQEELEQQYYDSARVSLERLIDFGKDDAMYHIGLGITYAGLGRKTDAIREGKMAVELKPILHPSQGQPSYLYELARIYTLVGDYEGAVGQLDKALSVPADFSSASLRVNPLWKPLRDYPPFQALLEKHDTSD